MRPGPRNVITDVAGLRVGHAQDTALKSGTTVLTADHALTASVHVMGGAPGSRETDLLAPDKSAPGVDALVLSGGSAFGLDACSGVMAGLREMGRGVPVLSAKVPIVPGAIIFDLINGGDKDWPNDIHGSPYPALGRKALEAASEDVALGTVGAGTGALTASVKGGLGSASFVLPSGATVAALMVANPMGSVTVPGTRHFWAAPYEQGEEFGGLGPDLRAGLGTGLALERMGAMMAYANTTIGIVATDAALDKAQCQRMAVAAHDGIARACLPAHSPMDGDLIFSVSTGARTLAEPDRDLMLIGHAASLCVARAIARAVYEAKPEAGDLLPSWIDLPA